jgi:23S rRNA (guanosine2251-2'-O)-methyltransferase
MPIRLGIHPVLEALKAGRPLERVLVAKGAGGPRIQEIIDLCRENSVPLRIEGREILDRLSRGSTHQGVVAVGGETRYSQLEDVLESARMLVVLDGVEDPHNLGAIIRTAHAAGAEAIVIPERRAVGVTETVVKAAAGALEHVPVVRVTNISRALETTKEHGFWIYGLDERGDHTYDSVKFTAPSVIVMGGEGKGLHQHVKRSCDYVVRIPLAGKIGSLNVSVAAGIILFEWKRRTQTA